MKTNHCYVGRDSFPANAAGYANRQLWKLLVVLAVAFFGVTGVGVGRIDAGCIALDDVPLDVQEQEAPGIVMFLIDNSGSMDWEFSCPADDQGKFTGSYEYLYNDPGDHTHTDTDVYLEFSATNKNKWKSQWAGYNRIYYDPTATYTPWPTFTNADLNNPKSDPVKTYTIDLSTVWTDFGDPAMSTESLQNAGAVFVDNKDTEAGQGLAAEIVMDNVNANNDVLWDGQDFGSFSPGVQAWTSATSTSDFETNYLYTGTKSKSYTATWSFTNIPTGNYDVYAWWVASTSNSTGVKYYVNGVNTATVNQESNGGKWVKIASNQNFPGSGTVELRHDNPNNTSNRAVADAVKIVPLFPAVPPVLFEKTGPESGLADQGWVLNITANAYKRPQDPNPTYYYTNAVGEFTATWTANNLVAGQLYDVYALWAQGGTNRYNAVPYTTTHVGGPTVTTVNQQLTLGDWTKIAGGATGITFAGGIGKVVLNRTTTSSTSGRACADAVAFVPHDSLAIKINRAHYYTQNATGTYLVNLQGSIKYYKYTEVLVDNIVQGNELKLLTPAEAAAAGIVTGRTYTQERQNFANWCSYYRRRELTAKNAIGKVVNDMQGVYIGYIGINNSFLQIALPVQVTLNNVTLDQSSDLLTKLWTISSSGGTPLRIGLKNVGEYFKGAFGKPGTMPSTNFASNTYPFFTADKGGTCQQAFTIAMTDGYWNESYSGVGNADGDHNTVFDGSPFGDTNSDTLADVAMHYYERDLNATLNNDVKVTTKDTADFQHLVTYTLSFGVEGSIDRDAFPDCPVGTCPTWTTPVQNTLTTIDDLYHAAINGRGKYVNAGSPTEMVDAMNALKQDIESRLGSSAALATSSIQRQVGTKIYQGTYNTAGWFGEVNALEVDIDTGAVSDPIWRASEHVPAWGSRNILSHDGSGGIEFEFANISDAQETLLSNNGHDPAELVDFIRGDTSNNLSHGGGTLRIRTKPLGDFVHSAPTYYEGTVYIGSNDGMLHAIDANTGAEKFCYVPAKVYDHLSELALPSYSHRYYVDGTATVGKVGSQQILVCGLGKGGKGYFGLDVTTPNAMTASNVLWEFPSGTDVDMGYAFSNATIVKTQAKGRVVVFGNGYDSASQKAVLYIVNPVTGALIKKLDTLTAGCNGLSTPKVVDVDGDTYADYAFAGDLLGNMWKFDLRGTSENDWKVYYAAGSTPKPLITVQNAAGIAQPITTAPEVMLDCVKSSFTASGGDGLMVIFGTGRYLNSSDFGDQSTQSFYGIWDWGNIWEEKSGGGATGYAVAKAKYLGIFQANRSLSNVSGRSLRQQTIESTSGDWLTFSKNPVSWFNPDTNLGIHMGWYFDLPEPGERGIREPLLRMGVAVLVSVTPSSSPCEAGGSSVLYQVSACSGGRTENPQFDQNGDEKFDDDDLINLKPPTGKKVDDIWFEPIEISDNLYPANSSGDPPDPLLVPANIVGMQFWRIIQ